MENKIEICEFQKETIKKKELIKIIITLRNGLLNDSSIKIFQVVNDSKFFFFLLI